LRLRLHSDAMRPQLRLAGRQNYFAILRHFLLDRTLGGCPRIVIFSQIKAFLKNKHSHLFDITSIIFSK